MKNTEYNGWTNYATWRVNLELFDSWEIETTPEGCEELALEIIFPDDEKDSLAESYARAWLADVNWYEISEAVNERIAQ